MQCLSFLDTDYFDNVLQEKETLIAEEDNKIVGLIDIEYELEPRTVFSHENMASGMICHITVHPDFQRRGIATAIKQKFTRVHEGMMYKSIVYFINV